MEEALEKAKEALEKTISDCHIKNRSDGMNVVSYATYKEIDKALKLIEKLLIKK